MDLMLDAEYTAIIINLINWPYNVDSVIKIVFMAFGVKHSYAKNFGGRKNDIFKTFLSSLSIKIMAHPEELQAIFNAIRILEYNGWIKIDKDKIKLEKRFEENIPKNNFMKSMEKKDVNPLIEIKNMSDYVFLEEVLQYV